MRGPELERYEILGELGQGGMSVVYRARDRQLARLVAVKVLHEFLARQADARRRFHREAVAVAKLRHPGILEIFDYSGPDAKDSYIVTELIDGETLREFIDKRGKPVYPELGVLVVTQLIRALKHAHEQSVVHRDLKPENVMIAKDGTLKLMDFGLAQLMDGGTKLTATGTLLGSPAHMAPEVIDGHSSDARADIFSMGTILYWLATGKLPFEAPNPSALFKRILDGKYEDPQMVEPKIGNGLARIIKKALEPDPTVRYQDVTEILADLEAELEAVGLTPAESQVRNYLIDPDVFTRELGPRLIETLASAGKQALAENNLARAMDRFNRVLAIDPDHVEVKSAVSRLGRKKELARRARRVATVAIVGTLLGGAGYGAYSAYLLIPKKTVEPVMSEPFTVTNVSNVTSTPTDSVAVADVSPNTSRVVETLSKRPNPGLNNKKTVRRVDNKNDVKPEAAKNDRPDAAVAASVPDASTPVLAEPQPVGAHLQLKFGNGVAKTVQLDHELVRTNGYTAKMDLAPGEHEVTIEGPSGPKTKVLRVDEDGVLAVKDPVMGWTKLKGELFVDLSQTP